MIEVYRKKDVAIELNDMGAFGSNKITTAKGSAIQVN